MSRWFRFYSEAMRNPKVLRLSDKDFRLWVNVLAVASENDGHIPPDDDLKLVLGVRLDHLQGGLNRLISGGLIDPLEHGYEPHNWSKFQYKSDTSTDRVQKHRAKRNVSVTPPDTETETEDTLSNERASTRAKRASTFPRPEFADPAVWGDFLKNRKTKRLSSTETAYRQVLSDIEKLVEQTGWPPGEILRACTAKGWGAIYATDEMKGNTSGKRSHHQHDEQPGLGKTGAAFAALNERLAQRDASGAGPAGFGEMRNVTPSRDDGGPASRVVPITRAVRSDGNDR